MGRQLIDNVQLLRFLAATAIVISHAADLLIRRDESTRWFWQLPWVAGVDLFFVISGFIMFLLTRGDFARPGASVAFLKRRLIRIVPPYWFFTTITVILVLAAGGRLGGTTIDGAQILTSYGFVPWPRSDGQINPIVSQGWTLNYEMFFYLSFALALLAKRGLAALVVAFVTIAALDPLIPSSLFLLKFWSDPIILEFIAGVALGHLYASGRRLSSLGSAAMIALSVAVFILIGAVQDGPLPRLVKFGLPAILFGAAFILSPEPARMGRVRQVFRVGGDASYTIYLAHYLIVHAVALGWQKAGLGLPWLGVAACVMAALAVGVPLYLWAERPVTQALQRRLTRPGAPARQPDGSKRFSS